jgi:hypothetical protein
MFSRLEKTSCSAIRGIGLASMSDTIGFLAHDIVYQGTGREYAISG